MTFARCISPSSRRSGASGCGTTPAWPASAGFESDSLPVHPAHNGLLSHYTRHLPSRPCDRALVPRAEKRTQRVPLRRQGRACAATPKHRLPAADRAHPPGKPTWAAPTGGLTYAAAASRALPPDTKASAQLCRLAFPGARSFDLEVTPWAPTRLTSCIFHPGPEEASGASTLAPGPAEQFRRVKFPPNRAASLCCTLAAFPGPEASTWR